MKKEVKAEILKKVRVGVMAVVIVFGIAGLGKMSYDAYRQGQEAALRDAEAEARMQKLDGKTNGNTNNNAVASDSAKIAIAIGENVMSGEKSEPKFEQIPILMGWNGDVYDFDGKRIPFGDVYDFMKRNPNYAKEFFYSNLMIRSLDTPERNDSLSYLEDEVLSEDAEDVSEHYNDYLWAYKEMNDGEIEPWDEDTAAKLIAWGMEKMYSEHTFGNAELATSAKALIDKIDEHAARGGQIPLCRYGSLWLSQTGEPLTEKDVKAYFAEHPMYKEVIEEVNDLLDKETGHDDRDYLLKARYLHDLTDDTPNNHEPLEESHSWLYYSMKGLRSHLEEKAEQTKKEDTKTDTPKKVVNKKSEKVVDENNGTCYYNPDSNSTSNSGKTETVKDSDLVWSSNETPDTVFDYEHPYVYIYAGIVYDVMKEAVLGYADIDGTVYDYYGDFLGYTRKYPRDLSGVTSEDPAVNPITMPD